MHSHQVLVLFHVERIPHNLHNSFLELLLQNVILSCRVEIIEELFFSFLESLFITSCYPFLRNLLFEHCVEFLCDGLNCELELPSEVFFRIFGWWDLWWLWALRNELVRLCHMDKVVFSRGKFF